ncbi:hypothetical protein [Glutamicibacter ardleyensis]|uniref:hypothetical protein n=1 Tax=Glutamicibacter ardleyensis TaxID=225894 RepID=UPI003FD4FB69
MRELLISLVVCSVVLVTGCSSQVEVEPDAKWCTNLKTSLGEQGIGWPVANQRMSQGQIYEIEAIFSSRAEMAQGDLRVAAEGWLQGYKQARPFLENNDQEGFAQSVSADFQKQLQLANLTISNICQWEEW